jgi:prepilin-type N-terminal cleavage/methylation domain-containing protein
MYSLTKGFTLAEVLITLLIIGIIASITIPGLIADMQDQQYKVAWKKTYSDFSQAVRKLSMDNAGNLINAFSSHDDLRNKVISNLSYTKTCDSGVPRGINGCWPASWHLASGVTGDVNITNTSRVILNNGVIASFYLHSPGCTGNLSTNGNQCGEVLIDINGFKEPNKVSKDIFAFEILRNGNITPAGSQSTTYRNLSTHYCDIKNYPDSKGWNCSADFLYQ